MVKFIGKKYHKVISKYGNGEYVSKSLLLAVKSKNLKIVELIVKNFLQSRFALFLKGHGNEKSPTGAVLLVFSIRQAHTTLQK